MMLARMFLLIACLAPVVRADAPATAPTYTNPLPVPGEIADPFVFRDDDGTYYLYGTAARDGLLVWTSSDLVSWQPRGHAYRRSADDWARRDFWAPELFKHRDKYYLHFTADARRSRDEEPLRRLVLAEGDSPLGPFRQVQAPWFESGDGRNVIDGHVLRDRDGKLYLYSVYLPRPDEVGFEIHVRALDDKLTPASKSTRCLAASEAWEGNNVNEGPFVLRHGDTYLLTYSGQPYWSPNYAVGIATARSPLGPWTKSKAGPILKRGPGVTGPGHHSFIESPDGKEMFIVYHVHKDPNSPGDPRGLAIDRVKMVDGPTPTVKVAGPTTQPQPLPSGVRSSR